MIRVAAIGDLHLTVRRAGRFRPALLRLRQRADLLLLAGDLTERGTAAEAAVLAAEVADLGLPTVAVLGNHDYLSGRPGGARVAAALREAGALLLDDTTTVLTVRGTRVGIAGTMGFGGGFAAGPTDDRADRLARALANLACDLRIALTHYAPTVDTLAGEPERLQGVLGSSALGAAIDAGGADLAVHGHAHHGIEHGTTPGGVPVRNVAYPVIRGEARVYHIHHGPGQKVELRTAEHDRVGAFVRWGSQRSLELAGRALQSVVARDPRRR